MADTQEVKAETNEQLPADAGNDAPPQAVPEAPAWIAEALADPGKQKDLLKVSRSLYDEDFAAHKEASEGRERSLRGQLSGAKAWQSLDESKQTAWLAELEDRPLAVKNAIAEGVPETFLEDRVTAQEVRAFHSKYIETNGATASKENGSSDDDAVANRMVEVLATKYGLKAAPPTEQIARGGGATPAGAKTLSELATVDLRGLNAEQIREHDKALDDATRAAGWKR